MECYITLSTGERKTFEDLPKGTYFLEGYQDPKEAGKAMYFHYDNGTCLTPIFQTENDEPIFKLEMAGKVL